MYTTKAMRNYKEGYPDGVSSDDVFSQIMYEAAEEMQSNFERVWSAVNGDLIGLELRNQTDSRWAALFPEMSDPECGPVRVQYYDQRGFSGHFVCKSAEDALEMMLHEGYKVLDLGRLDSLPSTLDWQIGTAKAGVKQLMDIGKITWEEMINRFEEIENKMRPPAFA